MTKSITDELNEWLRPDIDREAEFFWNLPAHAARRVERLNAAFLEADDEAKDWIIDDGAIAEDFLQQTCEIGLVAMYHWAERTLKLVLVRRRPHDKKIRKTNWKGLCEAFMKEGIDITAFSQASSVDALREFANSWKHQPDEPSDDLMDVLQLPRGSAKGHLSDSAVRDALARMVGLGAGGASEPDVLRALLERVSVFLKDVVKHWP